MTQRLSDPHCAISQALESIGDNWSLLVIREAFLGTRRFSDFQSRLGISKNVLTSRLEHLVARDILAKTDAGTFGKRFEYQLTAKGRDLVTVMTALRQWSDRWIFGRGNEPLLVVDKRSGKAIPPVRIRRTSGEEIPPQDLRLKLGPGATPQMKERLRQAKANRKELK